IIIDGDDIFGDGVNVAARLQEIAPPGGICVSSRVYDELRNRLSAFFEDGGERSRKKLARPVRVYRWIPGAPASGTAVQAVKVAARPAWLSYTIAAAAIVALGIGGWWWFSTPPGRSDAERAITASAVEAVRSVSSRPAIAVL